MQDICKGLMVELLHPEVGREWGLEKKGAAGARVR